MSMENPLSPAGHAPNGGVLYYSHVEISGFLQWTWYPSTYRVYSLRKCPNVKETGNHTYIQVRKRVILDSCAHSKRLFLQGAVPNAVQTAPVDRYARAVLNF